MAKKKQGKKKFIVMANVDFYLEVEIKADSLEEAIAEAEGQGGIMLARQATEGSMRGSGVYDCEVKITGVYEA